ncbi:hypothetical protein ANAPC4_01383 [Anaplasma phagocytophilum]|nr:hypothetical protein ANAPC4_01383 [Anaplasma phagocytophilum]
MGLDCHIDFVSYLEGWYGRLGCSRGSRLSICCQRGSCIWASKGKGRWDGSLGPSWERGRPKGIMGLLYMASNGLILRGTLVKPRPLRGLKGGVWSISMKFNC